MNYQKVSRLTHYKNAKNSDHLNLRVFQVPYLFCDPEQISYSIDPRMPTETDKNQTGQEDSFSSRAKSGLPVLSV